MPNIHDFHLHSRNTGIYCAVVIKTRGGQALTRETPRCHEMNLEEEVETKEKHLQHIRIRPQTQRQADDGEDHNSYGKQEG